MKKRLKKKVEREHREFEELVDKLCRKMTNIYDLIENGVAKCGDSNKWEGVSGFTHQIDVSLENDKDVLLVECKHWKDRNIPAEAFLALWGRLKDIEIGPDSKGRQFRAALVVSYGFQEGVEKLAQYYAKEISLFQITPNGDFKIVSATHFHTVRPAGIKAKTPAAIITIGNTSPPQPRPHTQGAPAVLACLT